MSAHLIRTVTVSVSLPGVAGSVCRDDGLTPEGGAQFMSEQVFIDVGNEVRSPSRHVPTLRDICCNTARLSWVLAAVAGLIGAAAFTHSAGYFVTFMTGNSERAVVGYFCGQRSIAIAAGVLLVAFVAGVVIASLCRRHLWRSATPHGPTVLTALFLVTAAAVDIAVDGWNTKEVSFVPVVFVALGIGSLNTSFVSNGEVSIPLSYVTGTLVKLGQGIERHLSGGQVGDWLGYFLLWGSFVTGAVIGGCISLIVSGSQMIAAAALVCVLLSAVTQVHSRCHVPRGPAGAQT